MSHPVAFFALVSALFYCVSMIAMKSFASAPNTLLIIVIALALVGASAFEIFALKQERLGLIYVSILAAEVAILGAVSLFQFDETYTRKEVFGMAIVLVGTAVAWS